jgi:hydroxyacylglutathione hydrolase
MLHRIKVVGPFQCNCHAFVDPVSREGLLVDPGDEPQVLLKWMKELETELGGPGQPIQWKYFLHTHAHLDHVGATRALKTVHTGAEISLHPRDEEIYSRLEDQGKLFGMRLDAPTPLDRRLQDGEILELGAGALKVEVLHTPGHSPGGCCFQVHENSSAGVTNPWLWTGDTLFRDSIGRTDLWEGDFDLLKRSIQNRLYSLDGDLGVYPGHGPKSSIGYERKNNPFVKGP